MLPTFCRESLLLSPRLKTGTIKEKLAKFGELESQSNSHPLLMKWKDFLPKAGCSRPPLTAMPQPRVAAGRAQPWKCCCGGNGPATSLRAENWQVSRLGFQGIICRLNVNEYYCY